jgi:hypothetical protein
VGRGGEKQAGRANWASEEFGPRGKKKIEMRERRGGPRGMDREEERRGFDSFFFSFFQILFKQLLKPLLKSNLLHLFHKLLLKTFKASPQQNSCIST